MTIPNEILHSIYDYVGYEESCMLNKSIYQHVKEANVKEFYCGNCTDTTCGHQHCKNLITYHKIIGMEQDMDFGGYSYITEYKEFSICDQCLFLGLIHFMDKHKVVPHGRDDGQKLIDLIKELRKMKPEKYLQLISSNKYKLMRNVVFDTYQEKTNMYRVFYHNKSRYQEAINKCIDIV